MKSRTFSQSALFLFAMGFTAHAQITPFTAGTQASAAAVNANFRYLDTSLTNSVARLTAQITALQAKAKADSTAMAAQIVALKGSTALTDSVTSLRAKAKADSTAMMAKIRLDSAAVGTQSIPKGTVAGFLTAPGTDGYLAGSNSTWLLAAGQGAVNGVTVPDLRGQFLRGIDYAVTGRATTGNDPDGTRLVGNNQADGFASHSHNLANWGLIGASIAGTWSTYNPDAVSLLQPGDGRVATSGRTAESFPHAMPEVGGSETRPKNVAVYWYVKVK